MSSFSVLKNEMKSFKNILMKFRDFKPMSKVFFKRMGSENFNKNIRNVSLSIVLCSSVFLGKQCLALSESKDKYELLKIKIADAIDKNFAARDDGTSIAPTLVRLAWHAAGTYSKADNTGGTNGATMRFPAESEWGANAGLKKARDFLEQFKTPDITYADLWTLAGVAAIEAMGGPKISWRAGRTDSKVPTKVEDGRLPGADKGENKKTISHIREVFNRMGFNDREIVALLGAHCLGRCHVENSGYWGPWTNAETTFSNEYFRLLVEEKWTEKKDHLGKPWKGPLQYENKDKNLMMLPSDLALLHDPEFKKIVVSYAKDEKAFFQDFSKAFTKLLELGVKF